VRSLLLTCPALDPQCAMCSCNLQDPAPQGIIPLGDASVDLLEANEASKDAREGRMFAITYEVRSSSQFRLALHALLLYSAEFHSSASTSVLQRVVVTLKAGYRP
jgi:hypothetical protein